MNKKNIGFILSIYVVFLIGISIISFAEYLLPEKYFIDSETIKSYFKVVDRFSFQFSDGFWNTAWLYKIFFIDNIDSRVIEGVINYVIYFICLFSLLFLVKGNFHVGKWLLLLVWNIPAAIYLGQLTKEIVVIPIITLLVWGFHKKNKSLATFSIILLLFYSAFFRTYWFIIIFYTFFIYLLINKGRSINKVLKFLVICFGTFLPFIVASIFGFYLTDTRFNVNEILESNSMINNFFINNSFFTDISNWFISWISIIFPLPILTMGSIIYVFFSLLIIVSTFYFLLILRRYRNGGYLDNSISLCISFIIGFTMVQGIFEPDYGSVLKHHISILPIYFYLLFNKEISLIRGKKN